MRVVIVGTGYVGLTSGVCFSEIGHDVTCLEIDQEKLEKLRDGVVTFFEPGLDELMQKNIKEGRLTFDSGVESYVAEADFIFLAVQTPQAADGHANLKFVKAAAKELGQAFAKHKVTHRPIVVNKSTVPVGTGSLVSKIIRREFDGEFDVVSNPEFLREGSAVKDFLEPDRVVVGTRSDYAEEKMKELYAPIEATKLFTTVESAEMIKYASNAFLATKISFINEIANVCEHTGADVEMVAKGMGLDDRIGPRFLNAGLGYGGSCFPKDVRALESIALNNGYEFKLLRAVIDVNNNQRNQMVRKMLDTLGSDLTGKRIGILGLAFKDFTDDIRESAAVDIITQLVERGAEVVGYDPEAMEVAKKYMETEIGYSETAEGVFDGSDAVLVATEWPEFAEIDFSSLKSKMRQPFVFDGKNMLDPLEMQDAGFVYVGVGRGDISSQDVRDSAEAMV